MNCEGFGQSKTTREGPGLEGVGWEQPSSLQLSWARGRKQVRIHLLEQILSKEGSGQMADPFQELPAQPFWAAGRSSCLALTLLAGILLQSPRVQSPHQRLEGRRCLARSPSSLNPGSYACSHCLTHPQSAPSRYRSCARHYFGCHAAFIRYPLSTAIGHRVWFSDLGP